MDTNIYPTGLDKVEQMFGKKSGHNVDPNKMRSTNEKIVSVLTLSSQIFENANPRRKQERKIHQG
jgi:hypothetical protein